jgi:hypothetical protein
MATDTHGGGVRELRIRSRAMPSTAPLSAAVMLGLADAVEYDASLRALLGQSLLDRPLAGPRLLAGLHELVLTGKAPELESLMYPPGADAAPADGHVLWKATRQAIFDHPDELRAALDWPVQQHLPGRAGFLLSGLAMLAQPRVRLFELGACAGLILQLDKYQWQGPDWTWGASGSPVQFQLGCPCPPPGLTITERGGCDIAPVDPTDPAMVRRLHTFVPPEFHKEHEDLDAALAIAAGQHQLVDNASAREWLELRLLGQPAPGVHTVVWHSFLWHQLEQAEQDGIRDVLFATAKRYPVTRISYEPYEVGGPATLIVESFP